MFKYKFSVLAALKAKGYTTARLRKTMLLPESSIQKLRDGEMVGIKVLERLCDLLECEPGDIIKRDFNDIEKAWILEQTTREIKSININNLKPGCSACGKGAKVKQVASYNDMEKGLRALKHFNPVKVVTYEQGGGPVYIVTEHSLEERRVNENGSLFKTSDCRSYRYNWKAEGGDLVLIDDLIFE